uniref:Uncharacterized protein n=2 Tax=Lotharella globosa TaxID=91324 RepID=A0A7S3Z4F9_9EUKA
MEQFLRWAFIELGENSKANFGIPEMEVIPIYLEPKWVEKYGEDPSMKVVNGFRTQFNEVTVELLVDDEVIVGYDYVAMAEDGFPEKRGNAFEILGKYLILRKVGDTQATDKTRAAVKTFGKLLQQAFDKYYAFGSIYSEDL